MLVFYGIFSISSEVKNKSVYARHIAVLALIIGQVAKSFELVFGSYLLFIAFVAVLVWITWSVLEGLPPSKEED